jgi:dTDP-4-amino-4,6-dideoxygalactose transaminase
VQPAGLRSREYEKMRTPTSNQTTMSESSLPRVPFLDLTLAHAELKEGFLADIAALIDSGMFVNGAAVAGFEDAFAAYCGTRHCVGLASGLDALRLGLAALGVGPGHEVLVPAMTFVATFEAVTQTGALPVPVDVTEADYGMDVGATAAAIGPQTRAMMPVHLYGQVADVASLTALARSNGLTLLEDACQAHGASRGGRRAGQFGDAAAFSFYPGKNLGALGDAGALVTDDSALADRVRSLREHGQRSKYRHDEVGWTARLDTIQASALLRKLPRLDSWNDERRALARTYLEALTDVGDLVLPSVPDDSEPVWHLFVVRTSDPDALAAFLDGRAISTGRHYPEPPHLTAAYASLGYELGSFPVAESLARGGISLPIFPGMSDGQVERVVDAIKSFFAGG